jgi:hypothetical protein
VVEGGPAARGGLKANDILLTVAGKPLNSQPALSEFVQKNGETPFEVEYLHEGSQRTLLKLTPEKRKAGQTFKLGVFTPSRGTTVVRRGSLQNGLSVGWTETPGVWDTWSASGAGLAPDGSAKRIDEMAAEIKELRKAIDGLRKALEDRK